MQWQTSYLKCDKETTLPKEYSSELVFNRNNKSQKRIVLNINHLSVYPVWLCSQLRTYFHFIANLWFHSHLF